VKHIDPSASKPVFLSQDHFQAACAIEIDEKAVFRLQGYRREQDKPDQRVRELYEQTMLEALPLLKPRGIFNYQPVSDINDQTIVLENNVVLQGKNIARTLAGAAYMAVGLVTVGPELENMVNQLFNNTDLAKGLMLDSIGSVAAEATAVYLDNLISGQVHEVGWNRTPRMSPGYGSFDIKQQHNIFAMIDATRLGVTLTESCIMLPQKSISFIIGCGPDVCHFSTLSPCRVCDAVDCPVRDPHSLRCNQ